MAVDTDGKYLMVNARVGRDGWPLSEDIPITDRPKHYGLFYPDGKTLFPGDELPITRALRGETTNNIEYLCPTIAERRGLLILMGDPYSTSKAI